MNWRHIPGSLNPADVGTREISPKDVSIDSVWFQGPKFLHDEPQLWPVSNVDINKVTLELKSTNRTAVNATMVNNLVVFI